MNNSFHFIERKVQEYSVYNNVAFSIDAYTLYFIE